VLLQQPQDLEPRVVTKAVLEIGDKSSREFNGYRTAGESPAAIPMGAFAGERLHKDPAGEKRKRAADHPLGRDMAGK
jgi:hypothetical protein